MKNLNIPPRIAMAVTPLVKAPAGYRMRARGEKGEIYLYGLIGQDWFGDGVTARQFAKDLKELGAVNAIDLRINSEGGSVFEGQTMYSLLVEHKAKVTAYVDGLAASAASFIAMAAEEIKIASGGFMMIHNAHSRMAGTADDFRREADLLDTVNGTIRQKYVDRTGADEAKVKKWMDDETWFNGQEAVDAGFADTVMPNLKVAACVNNPAAYKNLPAALRPRRAAASAVIAAMVTK
jgi:ATP-dependent protease ClpP protease subunit